MLWYLAKSPVSIMGSGLVGTLGGELAQESLMIIDVMWPASHSWGCYATLFYAVTLLLERSMNEIQRFPNYKKKSIS